MNIKKILSDFGSWIFAGLTFLGFIIIYAGIGARGRYKATGETNFYFIAVGIVLILPYLIYMLKTTILFNKAEDEESKRIADLIRTGDKVIVNLDNLEIHCNSYKQEIEVGGGYNARNEYIDVNHNVILIDVQYNNDSIKYKLNIDMDTTKLKMHFAIKKETELYVDSTNPNNNYLDLRFLES
ncbi:hypothetical protein LRR18_10590 [Mangrovimonas sp. AS39]|uniref:hypothetical protein n=1 Tax=Mangrovimonas futianensis TaxID=2895523 RepID=UPI001E39E46C|nr:hypothetical protein [Mangrovimonas futianensis]MCF1192030.1 hypothetical protein [Mangrovimonas futianensis]MCF1195724.1 hypothetical protein [Mangrovimonas futianensis]